MRWSVTMKNKKHMGVRHLRKIIVLAIAMIVSATDPTWATTKLQPGESALPHGKQGKLEFETYNALSPENWYNIVNRSYLAHPTTISGVLTLPSVLKGKVPAVVILHDSDGIQTSHEGAWAKLFNQNGYAAFVVDSFAGRGVTSTRANQEKVTEESFTIDAFQALRLLAKHEDIDAQRIAVTGYSKGSIAAYYSSWQFFQSRLSPDGLKFAAHLPVYSWCNIQEDQVKLTGAPMLFLSGGKDVYTPAKPCVRFVERAKSTGTDAQIIVYPNARHSFDDPSSPPGSDPKAWNSAACTWSVDYINNNDVFRPYYEGPWLPWSQFDKFWKGCFKRGASWGYNRSVEKQAKRDALQFLARVFGP
jgi:dienelactone hydrolase